MSELKYLPVTDELFPLLGKVYAQAWKGANSFFSTPGYLKKQTPERKAERFKKQFKREKNLSFYLVMLDNQPIGMYSTSLYPDGSGELRKIYLLPAYCGKGYGMEVLLHILWENRERERMFLWVLGPNERALRFFAKCGFVATGEQQDVAPEIGLVEYKMLLEGPLDVKAAVIRSLLRNERKAHESLLNDMLAHNRPQPPEQTLPVAASAEVTLAETDRLIAGWLKTLCTADGIAGEEDDVSAAAAGLLREYTDEVSVDRCRNVIARLQKAKPGQPEILLDAHLDEVGMLVKKIEDNGFVRATRAGGIDSRQLACQEVVLHGTRRIRGIVMLPAESGKMPDANDLLIDTGYTKEQLEEILSPGDMITAAGRFIRLAGYQLSSKALDDRSCAAAILYALELTRGEELPCGVTVLFSAQEEIGGHGAAAAAYTLHPDQALVSDVSFAWTPDADRNECGLLGKGGMIGIAPVLDRQMTDRLRTLAAGKGIPFQLEVMGGSTGTNADRIFSTGGGIPTALISLPEKYMHAPVEVVSTQDIAAVGRLMAEYLRQPVEKAGGWKEGAESDETVTS